MVINQQQNHDLNPLHPGLNPHLFGQKSSEEQFLKSWKQQKLHHAWLLEGPYGVGKATLAWRIARFMLAQSEGQNGTGGMFDEDDQQPDSMAIDENNPLFRQLVSGAHMNFRHITKQDKKAQISIEQIRNLRQFFAHSAGQSGWRVVIIDAVNDLTMQASNALLKMLEEPPENSLFLMVSQQTGRLLPTIKSRVINLRLQSLGEDDLNKILKNQLQNPPPAGDVFYHLAKGSAGLGVDLYFYDGTKLYHQLMKILIAKRAMRFQEVKSLITMMSNPTDQFKQKYQLLLHLYANWIYQLILDNQGMKPLIENDKMAVEQWQKSYRKDELLSKWQEVMQKSQAINPPQNLDAKQLIYSLFL